MDSDDVADRYDALSQPVLVFFARRVWLVRMLRAAGFARSDLRGPDGVRAYALGDHRMIAVAS